MSLFSVIIPCFNEAETIEGTYHKLAEVLCRGDINFELIFVDDGSRDQTLLKIKDLAFIHPDIKYVSLSRNFGKDPAIFAGLSLSRGDCAGVIDCDLQHPPEKLVEMYRLWEQGFQIVNGVKAERAESEGFINRIGAGAFNRIISTLTGLNLSGASDFKVLDRQVVDTLLSLHETNLFFRGLTSWLGFKTTDVPYKVEERAGGTSKWSKFGLFRYALKNIIEFSAAPMQLVTLAGLAFFLLATVIAIYTLIKYFAGFNLEGFTSVIILILFSSSLIMLALGVIGAYLAKIYDEVKNRPRFLVKEQRN